MSGSDTVFAGSIPAVYDRYMVPLIFRPFAELAVERVRFLQPQRILETAAGTGVVTQALHDALPQAEIVATDLNEPMLQQAATRVSAANVIFRQADALALPFGGDSFDLVICQFGVMFFPDKVKGHEEARRVLREGGVYVIVIWDSIERNVATKEVGAAVAQLFPDDAGAFYERIPFRYHNKALIESDLKAAGFREIAIDTMTLQSRAPSAKDAAIALTQGTPMRSEIEKYGGDALAQATEAATKALLQFEGQGGFCAPMSAHIVTAIK